MKVKIRVGGGVRVRVIVEAKLYLKLVSRLGFIFSLGFNLGVGMGVGVGVGVGLGLGMSAGNDVKGGLRNQGLKLQVGANEGGLKYLQRM